MKLTLIWYDFGRHLLDAGLIKHLFFLKLEFQTQAKNSRAEGISQIKQLSQVPSVPRAAIPRDLTRAAARPCLSRNVSSL